MLHLLLILTFLGTNLLPADVTKDTHIRNGIEKREYIIFFVFFTNHMLHQELLQIKPTHFTDILIYSCHVILPVRQAVLEKFYMI